MRPLGGPGEPRLSAASPAGDAGRDAAAEAVARLVAGVRAGRDDACRAFFDRYYRAARAAAYREVRNAADADDAAQITMVRAVQRLPRLVSEAQLHAWVTTTARRAAADARRADIRKRQHAMRAARHTNALEPTLNDPVGEAPELGTLEPREREALLLRTRTGGSMAHVSEAMGVSRNAVGGLVRRGLMKLRAKHGTGQSNSKERSL